MEKQKHRFIDTSYGEVMLVEAGDGYLDCYIGDNWDDYVCTILGNFYQDANTLAELVEDNLGQ